MRRVSSDSATGTRARRTSRRGSSPAAASGSTSPTTSVGARRTVAAATGLARESAFAVRLTTVIDTDAVGLLLRARRTVLVRGLGTTLSGRYLVSRVRHSVTTDRHVQQLSLVRNALGLKGDEPFAGSLLEGPI